MSKKSIRNCDYYRTPEALNAAFLAYCAKHKCIKCRYMESWQKSHLMVNSCNIFFAYDDYDGNSGVGLEENRNDKGCPSLTQQSPLEKVEQKSSDNLNKKQLETIVHE